MITTSAVCDSDKSLSVSLVGQDADMWVSLTELSFQKISKTYNIPSLVPNNGLVSRNHFVYEAKLLRVKLNNRKIRWLIQEKLRGRGSGELALIQKVTRRRVEQLCQTYRLTGTMPTLKQAGRPRKPRNLKEANLILQAYDTHQTNALTLQKIIFQEQHIHLPHNRIHEVLRMTGRAEPQPAKQLRRKWVRYERTHSMTLWHMDWK